MGEKQNFTSFVSYFSMFSRPTTAPAPTSLTKSPPSQSREDCQLRRGKASLMPADTKNQGTQGMTIPEHIWLPIAVVVSVIAALAFWWWWPKWQVNRLALEIKDPKARADVENNFRKTVGQLLGGAAVLFGAWLAFLQFSQQQQTAQSQIKQQQQAAQQQQQQQAARDL
jgi:hypothetical protein